MFKGRPWFLRFLNSRQKQNFCYFSPLFCCNMMKILFHFIQINIKGYLTIWHHDSQEEPYGFLKQNTNNNNKSHTRQDYNKLDVVYFITSLEKSGPYWWAIFGLALEFGQVKWQEWCKSDSTLYQPKYKITFFVKLSCS